MSFRHTLQALLAILICVMALPLRAETLREVMQANGVALTAQGPGTPDRSITSYAVANDEQMFAIAYYWQEEGADLLPETFQVNLFDKRAKSWTHAELPRRQESAGDSKPSWEIGSILGISHTGQRLYLDTHTNPSAGTLLILTKALQPVIALDGGLLAALPDDTVLYRRSMTHFAPTHATELWIYQPASGRDVKLYPAKPSMDPERFDNAFLPPVVVNDAGTAVAFVTRFGDDDKSSPAASPALDVLVVCQEVTSPAPRCSEGKLGEFQALHPGLSDRAALLKKAFEPIR